MNSNKTIQEDEIDLRELFAIVAQKKVLIAGITSAVTLLAVLYAYAATPIYEVKANIKIGHIGEELIASPESIVKTLQVVFNVEDKRDSKEQLVAEVSSVSANKKVPNFIELKAEGVSNEDALVKSKEVLAYLQELDKERIEHYLLETKNKIVVLDREISRIDTFEIKNIKEQIRLLKEQKITQINEKITRLKTQDIPKIEKAILISKTQDIAKIDEKISLLTDVELPSLDVKITYYTEKLNEYNHEIKKLTETIANTSNETSAMVSSIQMVNYQNLILASQNKIEDLKIQKEYILQDTILNLKRQKENIEKIKIRDLKLQIENINNVAILELQREKENIENEEIRKLEYKIASELHNKKVKLSEEIELLKYKISPQNIKNHELVGEFILYEHPIKPKKKLIVVVAFVTALMLSIFLVFFLNFIGKEEKTQG
ncbi:MAG: hypothetical protein IBX43_07280 [Campylobacterales bacterium]|nr:hypothetical protein [Campylobacterales bacterium]